MACVSIPQGPATRGLATLALLKVYFDQGQDHIEMFIPFVVDVIASRVSDDFASGDIKADLSSRHGLDVPVNAVNTVLGRVVRRGFARRDGGRYFRVSGKYEGVDLLRERASIEREHLAVVQRFREFAAARGVAVGSDEDALGLLFAFIEQNHVPLLVDTDPSQRILTHDVLSRKEASTVARFIVDVLHADPQLTTYLQRMMEGLVLQNVLLLRDLNVVRRRFSDLQVFFDTGFVLSALGLTGDPSAVVARETITLLKATGARIATFQKTVEEIKRVLSVYQRNLGTSAGIKSLRPTPVTRYFLTNRYSPSDVTQVMALLDVNISQLGMAIVIFPSRDPKYTLDEADLSRRLRRGDEADLEPRVMHDVDSSAAVLTLRAGRTSASFDDIGAVFATTSSLVVKTISAWYHDNGAGGVPPAIHVIGLSHIAWLKKPAAAVRLKLHELVAICSAALRPTRQTWDAFLKQLKRLEDSGQLTSDEAVAVVASALTDARLADLEDDEEVDAATVAEVVERVREGYVLEAKAATARATEEATRHAQERQAAETAALREVEARRQLRLRIYNRTDFLARWLAHGAFWLLALVIVVGLVFTLPGMLPGSSGWARVLVWIAITVFSLASAWGLLWGVYLSHAQLALESRVSRWLREWFVGPES